VACVSPPPPRRRRTLDANLPVFGLHSLADHVSYANYDMRLYSAMFTVLAIIALALAYTGLYAVISQLLRFE